MLNVKIDRYLVLIGIFSVAYFIHHHRRRQFRRFPLSLPSWPLVGTAFSMPRIDVHKFYKELGKKLGTNIIYLEAFGKPILILNDIKVAQDLLEKRSGTYSSRPEIPMLTEVVGFKGFFITMPYGDEWRLHRRMFQQYFSSSIPRLQEKELEFVRKGLLTNLYQSPLEFVNHIKNCVGGLSISVTYGLPAQRQRDPQIIAAEESLAAGGASSAPGRYLVNIIPQLKYVPEWFPGAQFKREAKKYRKGFDDSMNKPFLATLDTLASGRAQDCFVTDTLDRYQDKPDFELHSLHTKQTAVQVFGALFGTTTTSITTFFLAMLLYPDVQRRAQQEIDSVIGHDRLPEFSDLDELPYISAIVKEVLRREIFVSDRWNPAVPLGIPHLTTEEDIYEGFYIPKNCTIMYNAYAMLHDENAFPEPGKFKPSRFLKPDGTLCDDVLNPEDTGAFGFGRRECPGKNVGLSTLVITVASVLHLFDISPAFDEHGRPIEVKPEFDTDSVGSEPLPFPCKISPRKGKPVEGLLQDYFGNDPI
ncbi:O-methylsterigmatocystin oxidoreductase [Leucoagaricus sp. SymC.cos]|nr:O-methylsterigmatocystin oxidoreductase [Leucoagaricus sp. SymC.cos]